MNNNNATNGVMADYKSDSIQQAILQHALPPTEDGKITYKFEDKDGSSFEIKIKKESPSKTSHKISPKSVKETLKKVKNVLPWTKHQDDHNVGVSQADQMYGYGQGDVCEPIYEEIEGDDEYDIPEVNPTVNRLSLPIPTPDPASATSTAKSSASLPSSYNNDNYTNPYELGICHPRVGDNKAPYYSRPPKTDAENNNSSQLQHYDVPKKGSPMSNSLDYADTCEIRTHDVSSSYYSQPPEEAAGNNQLSEFDDNSYLVPNVTQSLSKQGQESDLADYYELEPCNNNTPRYSQSRSLDNENVVTEIQRDHKRRIPQDITCTKCNSIDSEEWDNLCAEYSEYSFQTDINDNNIEIDGKRLREEYVTMRPSIKLKDRKPEKEKMNKDDHHIPVDISNMQCPNIVDDSWDQLCEELCD
ncbi:uncharacterized protein [Amphiura filiformis]|uniref:uncharacterized protein n=1 Tax=Amphiura filiformis TaxID=82378 RepID=UPI003B20BC9F